MVVPAGILDVLHIDLEHGLYDRMEINVLTVRTQVKSKGYAPKKMKICSKKMNRNQ